MAEEEELVSVVSVVARALIAIEIRFPWVLFLLDAAEEKSARRPPPLPFSRQTEEEEDEEDDDDNCTAPRREETEDVCIIIIIGRSLFFMYIFCDDIFFCFIQNFLENWKKKRVTTRKASQKQGGRDLKRARLDQPRRRFLFCIGIAFSLSLVDARYIY